MCGTGRFLLPLIEEGFDVYGFDASNHMLEVLYAKAKAKNLEPKVWKGFFEDLKRPQKYNLIFIPSGSFCLILSITQEEKALKTIYDHLNNDGIFLFKAETLHAVPKQGVWRGSVIHAEIKELRVKIYQQDQLIEMLKVTGFKHIKTLKAFDQSFPSSDQDESIVYECRK